MVQLELGLDKGSAFNAEEYLRSLPDVKKGIGRYAELFRSHPVRAQARAGAAAVRRARRCTPQVTGQDPTGKPSLADVDKQVADLISRLLGSRP